MVSTGTILIDYPADKVVVTKGKNSVHYDLNGETVIPLQFGNGEYTLKYYRKIKDNVYRPFGPTHRYTVDNSDRYLLQPNCYVPEVPVAWDYARLLCRDKKGKAAYKTIISWVSKTIFYDYIKSVTVPKKGVLPDPAECWEKHRGICQDIASLVVGMLRAVDIPARLVIGRADGKLHAWVEAFIFGNDKYVRYDPYDKAKTYVKERWY